MDITGDVGDSGEVGKSLVKNRPSLEHSPHPAPCTTPQLCTAIVAMGFSDGWESGPLTCLMSQKPLPSHGIWEVEGPDRAWWPLKDSATLSPAHCAET